MKEKFDGLDPVMALNIRLGAAETLLNKFDLPPAICSLLLSNGQQVDDISDFALKIKTEKIDHIIMVGCGGTGSHLLPSLLQYIYSDCEKNGKAYPAITLFDGDSVEQKNLVRQKFTATDLNKNKAEALSLRYARAFGLKIGFVNGWLTKSSQLKELLDKPTTDNVLVIGAVDNHQARLVIYDFFMSASATQRFYWVDCGNETWHGQAIVGVSKKAGEEYNFPTATLATEDVTGITPCFFQALQKEIFRALEPLKPRNECARVVEENPQTIQANMMSANCGTSLAIQVLAGELRSMDVTFDANMCNTKATPITQATLFEALRSTKESRTVLKEFFAALMEKSEKPLEEEARIKEFFPHLYAISVQN